MIREFLMQLHWSWLPVVSMLLFMTVFFGAILWVFRKGSREIYIHLSELPLDSTERTPDHG